MISIGKIGFILKRFIAGHMALRTEILREPTLAQPSDSDSVLPHPNKENARLLQQRLTERQRQTQHY